MYNNALDIIRISDEQGLRISQIVLNNECKLQEKTSDEIRGKLGNILDIMMESANYSLDKEVRSVSGLTGGDAKRMEEYRKNGLTLCGDNMARAIARALSSSELNASMGRIVAAPTAGSCGILPSAIITAAEIAKADREKMIDALLVASGVGQIIAKNATLSGAEGGCQAECGSASAMAAAAIVEIFDGSTKASFDAGAMALKNVMGLVCDPVAGLVEIPCSKRNASGVVNAMLCADMALAGIKSMIPFDEVVIAMYKVGKSMPLQLKETALGGIATTATALKLKEEISGKL